MNEIVNIERLKQLLGIDVLCKDVEKLKLQLSNVNTQPIVDVKHLEKRIADFQKQVNQLNAEKEQLVTEKAQLSLANDRLSSEKKQLIAEIERIKAEKNELIGTNDKLQKQVGSLEVKISDLKKQLLDYDLLALYNQLDDVAKDQVDSYFPSSSDNKAMLFSALQENNIKNFYNVVRHNVNNKNNNPPLLALLRLVFDYYVSSGRVTLIEPNIGDPLDSDVHTSKSSNQLTGSPITELLLFGYKDSEGKVIQTALVNA